MYMQNVFLKDFDLRPHEAENLMKYCPTKEKDEHEF